MEGDRPKYGAAPKFSGENYRDWAFDFMNWAYPQQVGGLGLWDFFDEDLPRPAANAENDARAMYDRGRKQAYGQLLSAIEQISTRRLLEEFGPVRARHVPPAPRPEPALPRPREAWLCLQAFYERTEASTEDAVERELAALVQREGESLPEYWQRAVTLRLRYTNAGGVISQRSWRGKVLKGLPESWELFRVSRAADIQNLEEGLLLAALTQEANRQADKAAEGQALWVSGGAAGGSRGGSQRPNARPQRPQVPRGEGSTWGTGVAPDGCCWGCHKPGHRWEECRARPSDQAIPDQVLKQRGQGPLAWKPGGGWGQQDSKTRWQGGRQSAMKGGRAKVRFAKGKKGSAYQAEGTPDEGDDQDSSEEGKLLLVTAEDDPTVGTCSLVTTAEVRPVLDSGASQHFSPYMQDFNGPLEPPSILSVRVGDGRVLRCMGKGKVRVKGHNGRVLTFTDVHFVPDLHTRLISVSRLTDMGVEVLFGNGQAQVRDDQHLYFTATKVPGRRSALFLSNITMFPGKELQTPSPVFFASADAGSDQGEAWIAESVVGPVELAHQRMGHVAASTLHQMESKGIVQGLGLEGVTEVQAKAMPPCEPCLLGKTKRQPFPSASQHTSAHALGLVHMDLWGPVRVPTRGGKGKYVLSLIDDFTSYVWSFILPDKTSATVRTTLEDWYVKAKQQAAPWGLIVLRCDNGSEFQGEVSDWLREIGVERQYSAPYSPQQNGRVERWHRTMAEGIRTLLIHSGLPTNFWGEALQQVVWVKNRTSHKALPGFSTPFEEWTGMAADVSTARVWGSMGCVFLPDPELQREGKLGTKGVMCICLGVDAASKAWRMYDPERDRIRISRHVEFLEHIPWKTWQKGRKGGSLEVTEPSEVLTLLPLADLPAGAPEVASDLHQLGSEVIQAGPRRSARVAGRAPRPAVAAGGIPEVREEEEPEVVPVQGPVRPPMPPPPPRPSAAPAAPVRPQPQVPSRVQQGQDEPMPYVIGLAAPGATGGDDPARESLVDMLRRELQQDLQGMDDPAGAYAVIAEVLAAIGRAAEPITVQEALQGPDAHLWRTAISEEMAAMAKFGVWDKELVELPPGGHAVDSKLVFRIKTNEAGEPVRYKARFVARGFTQRFGEDYGETFSSVAKMPAVRLLLALAAVHDLELHVVDVDNAFLNADLDEELYLQQPKGADDGSGRVYRLRKALYGLKQAPRVWNEELGRCLGAAGFKRAHSDDALYLLWTRQGGFCFIPTWVDDLMLVSNSLDGINAAKEVLEAGFSIKDLGEISLYLGMQISRDRQLGVVEIGLQKYTEGLAKRFPDLMLGGKVSTPMAPDALQKIRLGGWSVEEAAKVAPKEYMSVLGCLMYAATTCRPDISFSVSTLAQASSDPRALHLAAASRVLRYLVQTKGFVLRYSRGDGGDLLGYTDSDWGNEPTGQSRNAFVFKLAGGAVSWQTKKLASIADSTTVAEYKALSTGAKEAIWYRQLLEELGLPSPPVLMHTDSQSACSVAKDSSLHQKTKHVRVVWHTIRQAITEGECQLKWIPTGLQVADGLTKALQGTPFQLSRQQLGIVAGSAKDL